MGKVSFEVLHKDIAARIGRLELNGKRIETPALMPVYSPKKPLIPAKELKEEFNSDILMTNSYIILRDKELKKKVLKDGIHKYLGFNGLIATDSGSYQLMSYGSVLTTNSVIIKFQEEIGSDIGSFLDIPSMPDAYKPRADEQLGTTLERAKEAINAGFVVNAGIQGSTYLDLRKRAAKNIGKDFELCAIGGIVKLMEDYRFADLVDIIATVKKNIPSNRVVHAFGLGHPISFSIAVALGCDLFDSAAYALYAQGGRYMTENGTKRLEELEYLPCSCPVCNKHGTGLKELPEEKRIKELARHNLYVTNEELNRVKEAIREGSLWELLSIRTRAHPALLDGLRSMLKHKRWLAKFDPIRKRSAFHSLGFEAKHRTEVVNVRSRVKRVPSKNMIDIQPFGKIPAEISELYPFHSPGNKIPDLDKVRAIMDYQFGEGAGELIPSRVRIKKSRKTKRIRWVYEGKDLIASVRASDHFIIPKRKLAEKIKEKFKAPRNRVVIHDDAIPFVSEKKSVFAKFVTAIDSELRPGDEVLVVDKDDNLIRTGTLVLSPAEVKDFDRGPAVRVR